MMRFYPDMALQQLEFDKVAQLLITYCRTSYAQHQAKQLKIHTKKSVIEKALEETAEYTRILDSGYDIPNQFINDIRNDIKMLSIPGATLLEEQFRNILSLAENTGSIKKWFHKDREDAYPRLHAVHSEVDYTYDVEEQIHDVLDASGQVKDQASDELSRIRQLIHGKRNEQRKIFRGLITRYGKLGYLADIEESFMNGRRVLAVVAEYKRMVSGVVHGESDSRRTIYIEPEETTSINNDLFTLHWDERKEIEKILRALTARLSKYSTMIASWLKLAGELDFIGAKARFAKQYKGTLPQLFDKAIVDLKDAYHPLLLLQNERLQKPTIPLTVRLDEQNRLLIISGPNAGGKTVTMRTIGLLQLMLQSGLLVPVHPDSEMGIFKQLFVHIGDMQSIEFELSTYAAQLKNMKHFTENANGKTLVFIDELGSGSDPVLGGAFAEVFLEVLAQKHAMGVVTTHYLNLKIMANHVKGIVNGAMLFNEKELKPLYKLKIGQPGSSYTFSIAERIGIAPDLINRAKKLAAKDHVRLDTLLNKTEQDFQQVKRSQEKLEKLLEENKRLKKEMEHVISRESHKQEMEKLRQQNKITAERLVYLKDMERKLKAMVIEWRKADDKQKAVKMIQVLLFGQKEKLVVGKKEKEMQARYEEVSVPLQEGAMVKLKKNKVVGVIKEIKGKKAVVQVGVLPVTVNTEDLVVVQDKKAQEEKT